MINNLTLNVIYTCIILNSKKKPTIKCKLYMDRIVKVVTT